LEGAPELLLPLAVRVRPRQSGRGTLPPPIGHSEKIPLVTVGPAGIEPATDGL
jgi:hypothetical protein